MKTIFFKTLHFFIDTRGIQQNGKSDQNSIEDFSKKQFSRRAYGTNIIPPLYEDWGKTKLA